MVDPVEIGTNKLKLSWKMIRKENVMAGSKTNNKSGNKSQKKKKNIEPGFFSDYGGNVLIITKRPKNDKK